MNICLISSEYPPETSWGGIGTYIYNMVHAFSDSGHEVHIVAQAVRSSCPLKKPQRMIY